VSRAGLLFATLFIAIILATFATVYAQPSEDEAKAKFEALGCTGCHNGGVAPTWDDVVAKFKEWKNKYGSLDDAVKNEVNYFGQKFNSYDEMMKTMAGNSAAGTPDNPDFQVIDQFLRSIFTGGAGAPTETETATETGAQTTTQTGAGTTTQETTQSPTQSPTETPTETGTPATETPKPRMGFGTIVGIAIVILIVVVLAAYVIAMK